jgi:hypothetical protein
MPLFAYFAVVAPALLALLFFAEAQLGPPKAATLALSTEFHGLPKPFKAPNAVAILTVRDAPAPDRSAVTGAVAAASRQPIMAQATAAEPQPAKPVKRRAAANRPAESPFDRFAHGPAQYPPAHYASGQTRQLNAFGQAPQQNTVGPARPRNTSSAAPRRGTVARAPLREHGVVW